MKRIGSFTSLKDLKVIKETFKVRKTAHRAKTDEEFFIEAMAEVREIREFREIPFESPRGIKPHAVRQENGVEILKQIVKGEGKIRLSDTGEYMEWTSPRVSGDITRRLHQGDFAV